MTLVDVDGRPPPEKMFLGSYGAQILELQVDQNAAAEGETPRAPVDAHFQVAGRLPTVGNPNAEWRAYGAYDLPVGEGWQSRVAAVGAAVDPRTGLAYALLKNDDWLAQTATDRFTRPPAGNNTGLDNTDLPFRELTVRLTAPASPRCYCASSGRR